MKKKLLFNAAILAACITFSLVEVDVKSGEGYVVSIPHDVYFLFDGPFCQGILVPTRPSWDEHPLKHYGAFPRNGEYGKMFSLELSWRFGEWPNWPFWEMEHYRTTDPPEDARLPEWDFYGGFRDNDSWSVTVEKAP